MIAILLILLILSTASAAPNPGGGVLFPIREAPELQAQMKRFHLTAGKYEQPHPIAASAKSDRERYAAVHGKPFPSHLRFLLFKPNSDSGRRVPLLVYFPGSGEVGDDLMRQFRHTGIFSIVTSADFQSRHPCYLLAISLPTGTRTLVDGLPGKPSAMQELVMGAVRTVAAASTGPAVDMNRLYVTGFSFGGECTYGLALSYPDVFAAAMPVASFPPPPQYISPHHPGAWWHIYNAGDYSVHGITPAMLTPFVKRVESLGGEFRTGTYPRDGHNAWSAAWQEQPAWNWLFSKTLDGSKVDDETQAAKVLSGPKPVGKSEADKLKRVVAKDLKGAQCTASVPGKAADSMPNLAVDGLDGTAYVSAKPVKKGRLVQGRVPVGGQRHSHRKDRRRQREGQRGRTLQRSRGGLLRRQHVETARQVLGKDRRMRTPPQDGCHQVHPHPPRARQAATPRHPRNHRHAVAR